MRHKRRFGACLAVGVVLVTLGSTLGCATREPSRDPVGEVLPLLTAETLDGEALRLPGDLAGAPAVLLVGYVQEAQFDADRWLLGLMQAEMKTRVLEVPTIPGALVGLLSNRIDDGMRSGIPSEDWGVVATVYGRQAGDLEVFTGSERPRNIRVLLLDAEGEVRWFHDRGYSAGTLMALRAAIEELDDAP